MAGSELLQWVTNVGLYDYYCLLWDAGHRDLGSVASLSKVGLNEAGIEGTETVDTFLREIAKLRSGNLQSQFLTTLRHNIKCV